LSERREEGAPKAQRTIWSKRERERERPSHEKREEKKTDTKKRRRKRTKRARFESHSEVGICKHQYTQDNYSV
jgi:hypothetical protein